MGSSFLSFLRALFHLQLRAWFPNPSLLAHLYHSTTTEVGISEPQGVPLCITHHGWEGTCSQPCLAALAYTNRVYSEMTERSRCTLQSMSNTRIPTPQDRPFPPKQLSTSLLSQLGHPSCVEKKFLNSGSSSNLLHHCPASLDATVSTRRS